MCGGSASRPPTRLPRRSASPHDSPDRVKAGLQFALSEAGDEGHCYLPEGELIAKAVEILGVEAPLAERCLAELVQAGGVMQEDVSGGPPAPAPVRLPR